MHDTNSSRSLLDEHTVAGLNAMSFSIEEFFPLLMFPVLFIGILSGFPVAFVLSGVGLLFGLLGHFWLDIFSLSDFGFI